MAGGAVAGVVIGVIACLALAALLVVLLRNRCIPDTCCPSTILHQIEFCLFILTSNNFELCAWFRNWEVRRLLPASMQTTTSSGSAFQNMSYSSGYNFHRHLSSLNIIECANIFPLVMYFFMPFPKYFMKTLVNN